jgi:predicted DCC family thiol-disulfide oxidoreductase YuxK
MTDHKTEKPIILIDSKCSFCSKTGQFIARKGGENKFQFLSLYSEEGKKQLLKYGLPEDYRDSVVLIENDSVFLKSDAVLKISKKLNSIYPFFSQFKFIPQKIRDSIYDFVARHRNKFN